MIGRMLARVCLVKALTHPTPYNDLPTMAGDRVFDSKLTPTQLTETQPEIPIIIVYSSEQRVKEGKYEISPSFAKFAQLNEFIIEIAVAAYSEQVDEIDGEKVTKKVLNVVENDEELMAVLDMFEAQVWRVLHDAGNPWTKVWASLVKNAVDYASDLEADGEKNNTFAMRQIKLTVELCPDPTPRYGVTEGPSIVIPPPYDPQNPEFPSLLDTYLGSMISQLTKQPDTSTIVAALRSTLGDPQAILLPTLKRVSMLYHGDPSADEPGGVTLATQELEIGQEG